MRKLTVDNKADRPIATSKLDLARQKLSKFKLKYGTGKQESKHNSDTDPSFSLTDLSPESPTTRWSDRQIISSVYNPRPDDISISKNQSDGNISNEHDSLVDVPAHKVLYDELPMGRITHEKVKLELPFHDDSQSSSISEMKENVYSFSALEVQSDLKDISDNKRIDFELDKSESSIQSVLTQQQSTQDTVSSITEESTGGPKEGTDVPILVSVSKKKLQVVPVPVADARATHHVPSERSSSDDRKENIFATKDSTSKSSLTVTSVSSYKFPLRKENTKATKLPQRRNAKVQTDMKRSRSVQVKLSDTSSARDVVKRSCPILRASHLPIGLRIDDNELHIMGIGTDPGDALELLLQAQMQLTLGLLRRQQTLYINSCSAAARLEQNYRQETLLDTRRFIRREKRLREELRKSGK